MKNRPRSKVLKRVIPSFAVATTSKNLKTLHSLAGLDIDLEVLSGNIWVNPGATATEGNGAKVSSATLSVIVMEDFNIISDSSGATVQIWVYE